MNTKLVAVTALLATLIVGVTHADPLTPEQLDGICKAAIPQGKVYRECSYEDRMAAAQVKTAQVVADSYKQQYQDHLAQYEMILSTRGLRSDLCGQIFILKMLSLQMKDAANYEKWGTLSHLVYHCE